MDVEAKKAVSGKAGNLCGNQYPTAILTEAYPPS